MGIDKATALREIDGALGEVQQAKARSRHDDCSDLKDLPRLASRIISTIERFAPPGSHQARQCAKFTAEYWAAPHVIVSDLSHVLQALRDDVACDRLTSVIELVHADVFSDFLDMAKHLLDQGFKDPAAVIAGSSLEAHLRAMCARHGIDTNLAGKAKRAELLNQELDKAGVYNSKGDQKSVTAWLDLRNDAAHGHYGNYLPPQVNLLIAGVRDFMVRYPA
jgi:hypothetical protein